MRKEILKKIRQDMKKRGKTLVLLSEEMNIPYASLWRMVNLERGGLKNWEKAEAYYKKVA